MEQKAKKRNRYKWLYALLAFFLASAFFFAGFGVRALTESRAARTLDWIFDKIQKYYYEDYTERELLDGVTDYINDAFLDAYSAYYTPEEYRIIEAQSRGERAGIGVAVTSQTDLTVYRVGGNSPAEHAGIQKGDVLTGGEIGGESVAFTDYDSFVSALGGVEIGVPFTLRLTRAGTPYSVEISKHEYIENCVYYADKTLSARFTSADGSTPVWSEQVAQNTVFGGDTAYIRLTSFTGQAYLQFERAMQALKARGKTQLILDVRQNGGGRMDILTNVASHLAASDKQTFAVAVARYKGGKQEVFTAQRCLYGEYGFTAGSVVVLADEGSASASEALIGALLDYGTIAREQLVITQYGERALTYGKGIMQTTFAHPTGGQAIKLTTAKIFWPVSDTCVHGTGIGTVENNRIAPAASNLPYTYVGDSELMRAVQILAEQAA